MDKVQQIVPISEMATRQQAVMRLLATGPVVLASRSRPVAVLVSVQDWDALISEVEELRDKLDVQEADLALGDETIEDFDLDELRQMAGHAVPA
ncbi:MAG: type II toxin-antitoxin system prevent-host-death family antitoxin [Caldilineaceae bacterium]